jgi:hypothetical protein
LRRFRRFLRILPILLPALVGLSPAPNTEPPVFLGERLVFAMTILGIAGGELTLSAENTELAGKPVYKFELSALSNDFLSKFFLVREYMVSWVDPATFRSIRFEKHSVEGRRVRDEQTEFDYENDTVTIDGVPRPLMDATLDTLSSVYYLRTVTLSSHEKPIELRVVSREIDTLHIDVQAKESVTTPAGVFRTIRVEPKSDGTHLLGKNLVLWLTDDDRRVPVQIKSKLKVGTLFGKLKSIEHVHSPTSAESRSPTPTRPVSASGC